jgi:hypothetical protein
VPASHATPEAQELGPEQEDLQVAWLHDTRPEHAPFAVQQIALVVAVLVTEPLQEPDPPHTTVQD